MLLIVFNKCSLSLSVFTKLLHQTHGNCLLHKHTPAHPHCHTHSTHSVGMLTALHHPTAAHPTLPSPSLYHPPRGLSPCPQPLCTLPHCPLVLLSYLIHNRPPHCRHPPFPPRSFTLPHAPPARHAPSFFFFYGHSPGEEEEDEEAGAFTGEQSAREMKNERALN